MVEKLTSKKERYVASPVAPPPSLDQSEIPVDPNEDPRVGKYGTLGLFAYKPLRYEKS